MSPFLSSVLLTSIPSLRNSSASCCSFSVSSRGGRVGNSDGVSISNSVKSLFTVLFKSSDFVYFFNLVS